MGENERTNAANPASDFQPAERLWTPWRMQYVGEGTHEDGCVFCNRLAESDDISSLILHRGKHAFAIMNLFPYNTGHVMILPNAHVADPTELSEEAAAEMTALLPQILQAVRRALGPGGFNVGMNLGSIAGAGIAAHLHQHLVPRWPGDANFMPVLANTKALPELIPVTYAKIRAELERIDRIPLVALSPDLATIYLEEDGSLPAFAPTAETAIWRQGQSVLAERGFDGFVAGWAGSESAADHTQPAIIVVGRPAPGSSFVPKPSRECNEAAVQLALRHTRAD